ncbi:MAG: PAS domain S-box protein, partial [Desulfamplus sp.]|nr:PAS domain S-box protein [Desulfamplus sp.]
MDYLNCYFRKLWHIIRTTVIFLFDQVKTNTNIYQTIQNYKIDINNLQKLKSAIEENPSIVIITDKNGVIEYVNPAFTKITGYTKTEAIGKTPGGLLASGEHSVEFYRDIWDTIVKGDIWQGELLNKNSQDELQWQYTRISSIKDSQGNIVNYLGIQEDI